MTHSVSRVRVRVIAVLEMHPGLILDRPRRGRNRNQETGLDLTQHGEEGYAGPSDGSETMLSHGVNG